MNALDRFTELLKRLVPQTLEERLRWFCLSLILLPGLLFAGMFSVYQINHERQETIVNMQQDIRLGSQMISQWITNKNTKIRTLAGLDGVRSMNVERIKRDFKSSLAADDRFSDLLFVNGQGMIEVAVTNAVGKSLAEYQFFQRAAHGESTVAELTTMKTTGISSMVFAQPVYDYDGHFAGAVIGVMPMEAIDRFVATLSFGITGEAYLVDRYGVRVTVPRFAREAHLEPEGTACYLQPLDNTAVHGVLARNSGTAVYDNCLGKRVISVFQPVEGRDWGIVGEINEEEVLQPIYAQINIILLIIVLIMVSLAPLTLILAQSIKKPLESLLSGAERIARQDYSCRVNCEGINTSPTEVKKLCNTFNEMAAMIADHRDNLEDIIKKRTASLERVIKKLRAENRVRRKTELSLVQSEEKYRVLFDKATDAIMLVERIPEKLSGQVAEVNDKACRLLGYSRQELLELTLAEIDLHLKNGGCPKTQYMQDYENMLIESVFVMKDGRTCPVEINVHQFPLRGKRFFLIVARDITLRRQMEQEMARMERLNMVGEMAASIGHEVRNPMTTVRGFLQMLGRKKENEKNADYFALMIEELDRANGIITEFLSLAKNKTVDLKEVNLNNIIKTLEPLLRADAIISNKEVEIFLGDIPPTRLDEKEIRQLILNLVRNGLEAMPPNTRLTISTYLEEDNVVLAIRDQGAGIPHDIMDKIGTPFFTTKENGTGLGVAVCYSIAGRHQAAMDIDTGSDGTTFYVRFKPA